MNVSPSSSSQDAQRPSWLPALAVHLSLGILILLAIQPLISSDFTCGYDTAFHMWRSVQVGHLLRQGVLFPRFAPDMAHGYGFLLFNFVGPGSAYVAALFNLLGLSWPLAVNTTFVLGMAVGGYFVFVLVRDLFGPLAGLVAAAAYLFAPFQAYDVFNRGGLSESFAWAFPALVLWAIHRWCHQGRARFLLLAAFSLAGFILTHNLFAFLFTPVLGGWVLLEAYLAGDRRLVWRGIGAGLLGLGVCTFFWLPGLVERPWVQTGRLLGTWVFDYRNNFLRLDHLLALPQGVDPSLINDWPPKALGLVPSLLALLPLAFWRRMERASRWRVGLYLACGAGYALLTLPISRPLWDHLPLLPYVQFPWRFLGPAAFCLALLAGAAASVLISWLSRFRLAGSPVLWPVVSCLSVVLLIVGLVLANLGWFYPDHCAPPADRSVAGMIAWERATDTLGATAKGEYLPIWVHQMPDGSALDQAYARGGPIPRLAVEDLPPGARVLQAHYGPTEATIELESPVRFTVRYRAFYYPGWRVTVDDRLVAVAPTEPEGLLSFDVPPGRHVVRVWFGETLLRLVADGISLAMLAGLILFGVFRRRPFRLPRPTPQLGGLLGITLVTLAFLLAIAVDADPHLRGPEAWRWAYAIPGRLDHLWLPVSVLSAYLLLALVWVAQAVREDGRWRRVLLLALVLAVPLVQVSLLGVDFVRPLFYRTVSVGSSGVFSVSTIIDDPADYLRNYPALMDQLPVHPQRYPPGLPLLFYAARRLLERVPGLADGLGFPLRRLQCHDQPLMRLDNPTLASAVVQMALPLASGLTLLPLYGLARQAYGRRVAAWSVAVYPLVASFAMWAGRWEQVFPLLSCTAWYLLYTGLARSRRWAMLAAGLTLSLASTLNFSFVALLLPMGVFALIWVFFFPGFRPIRWGRLVVDGLIFLVGLVSLWGLYRLALGTGFLDVWRVSMSYHLGMHRDYWTWVVYHLYDFFVFLGIPLALLFGVGLATAVRHRDGLILGFGLGVLLLDLAGVAQGEVARVWIFLTPFAALAAVAGLARLRPGRRGFGMVLGLQALQLLVFATFLRVVTTGLIDPPTWARVFQSPPISQPVNARFRVGDEEAIALLGYDLAPKSPVTGDTLRVTLYWQSLQPVAVPYNVFVHLVDAQGGVAGQRDGVPLKNHAPTTCWVPGEVIADEYEIPVPPSAPAGPYTLQAGLYFWRTGERLPVHGEGATPDGRLVLSPVLIGEP